MTEQATSDRRLFIGNLPPSIKPHVIADKLTKYREVSVCIFNPNLSAKRRPAFAFVTFPTVEEADKALEELKELHVGSRPAVVQKSEKRQSKPDSGEGSTEPAAESDGDAVAAETDRASAPVAGDKAEVSETNGTPRRGRTPRVKTEDTTDTVYISGVPIDVTEKQIVELLSNYNDVVIDIHHVKARSRRFKGGVKRELPAKSFVFAKVGDKYQQEVIEKLNGTEWKGGVLKVSKASENPAATA